MSLIIVFLYIVCYGSIFADGLKTFNRYIFLTYNNFLNWFHFIKTGFNTSFNTTFLVFVNL